VRVVPHPDPLYRIEGEMGRRADGIYDKMGPVGAHEVVVETPDHNKRLSQLSDEEIERVIWVWASRVSDLKKDVRLKHVSVFKNQGVLSGEEWPHAHSEVTGTIFVPRRIKYELRASREWYREKERCVFLRHRAPGRKARQENRGRAGRLLRVVSVRGACAI